MKICAHAKLSWCYSAFFWPAHTAPVCRQHSDLMLLCQSVPPPLYPIFLSRGLELALNLMMLSLVVLFLTISLRAELLKQSDSWLSLPFCRPTPPLWIWARQPSFPLFSEFATSVLIIVEITTTLNLIPLSDLVETEGLVVGAVKIFWNGFNLCRLWDRTKIKTSQVSHDVNFLGLLFKSADL